MLLCTFSLLSLPLCLSLSLSLPLSLCTYIYICTCVHTCVSYHIISYNVVSRDILPSHVIPYRTMPYQIIPHHTVPFSYHIIPYRIIPYQMSCNSVKAGTKPYTPNQTDGSLRAALLASTAGAADSMDVGLRRLLQSCVLASGLMATLRVLRGVAGLRVVKNHLQNLRKQTRISYLLPARHHHEWELFKSCVNTRGL